MSTSDTSTAPVDQALAGACPRCGSPVGAAPGGADGTDPNPVCPRCHLELGGPLVAELSGLNRRHAELRRYRSEVLAGLDGELEANDRRRGELLAALDPTGPTTATTSQHPTPATTRPAHETNGRGTQALLLGLGVLCLAIAVAVFAAVGWGRLNPAGQAAVLLAATVAAGLGGLGLHRRGLRATGEAVLCLAAAMVLVDIAVFGDALGAGTGDLRFWSAGLALLAGLGAATRRWGGGDGAEPPLAGALIGVVAAQLTLPMAVAAALGARSGTGFDLTLWDPRLTQVGIAGVAVVGIVQAIGVTLVTRERRWNPAAPVVAVGLATAASGWFVAACMALALTEPAAMAAVLAGAAIAAALAVSLPQLGSAWTNVAAAGTVATALGAWTALAPDALTPTVWVAIGAAAAVLVACATPERSRAGGVLVGGLVLAGTAWVLLAAVGYALEYLEMLVDGAPGAVDIAVRSPWGEVLAVALILTATGLAAAMITVPVTDPRAWAGRLAAVAAALAGYLAIVLPPLTGAGGLVWALVLAGVALTCGLVAVVGAPTATTRWLTWAAAGTMAAGALTLAFAGDDLWLWWALTASAAAFAGVTGRTGRTDEGAALAGTATLLTVAGAAWTAALLDAGPTGVSTTAATTAGVLAVAAATVLWAAAGDASPGRAARWVAGQTWSAVARPVIPLALGAQGIAMVVAVADSIDRQASLSGTVNLLIGALAWFAVALLTRRQPAAVVGAVLTQCAAWLALGIAGVVLVEAYTVPGSLVLLGLGIEALRRTPSRSSWAALSPALAFALIPSSLIALGDGGARVLALIALGALLVVVGAVLRLGAPVVAGACCVVTLSFVELAPLIGSLPRYLTFGVAGAVLLITGATFERRRAELAALHRQLRSLR